MPITVKPIKFTRRDDVDYYMLTLPKSLDERFVDKKLMVSASGNSLIYTISGGITNG